LHKALADIEKALIRSYSPVTTRRAAPVDQVVREFGATLSDAVLTGDVRRLFAGVRLVLLWADRAGRTRGPRDDARTGSSEDARWQPGVATSGSLPFLRRDPDLRRPGTGACHAAPGARPAAAGTAAQAPP